MVFYQVQLALLSLRRTPMLSLILVLAIALGIGVSSAMLSISYLLTGNPIPHKSEILYYVELDSWDPEEPCSKAKPDKPPNQITYRDMRGIMQSDIPTHQSGMFASRMVAHPVNSELRPFNVKVRFCFAGFFPMFDTPFAYGGGWDDAADDNTEAVVVIDKVTNDRLFGGANSVGESIRLDERTYTVVGVLDAWKPIPRFYDVTTGPYLNPEGVYLPFSHHMILEPESSGNYSIWGPSADDTYESLLRSEGVWIQFWVQLDTEQQKQRYDDFLAAYVQQQKQLGRFGRPLNNRLLNVMELLKDEEVSPKETAGVLLISLLFLLVCSFNLIGILLSKFLARAPEVGVRRALGASRTSVFLEHLFECELVGISGGVLGIGLSAVVLRIINQMLDNDGLYYLDLNMVLAALFLSLIAGAVAGAYPAWRICKVVPATHLKLQ